MSRASTAAAVIAVVTLLLFGGGLFFAGGARAYNPLPNGTGQIAIEPNPWVEGNVTIATHTAGWGPLQYAATSGQGNLSASLDPRVVNPYQINPSDIVATGSLQQTKQPTATVVSYWNSSSYWGHPAASCANTVTAAAVATVNGVQVIQASENATNCNPGVNNNLITSPSIPVVNYPSSNVAFDYITLIYGLSGPACPGGAGTCYLVGGISNASAGGGGSSSNYPCYGAKTGVATEGAASATCELAPGGVGYYSISLAQLSNSHAGFNDTTGGSNSLSVQAYLQLVVPKTSATTTTYTATIYGWEFSTAPFTFGTTTWGGVVTTRTVDPGTLNLTTWAPTQTYQSVSGGGWTTAIAERANNLPGANVSITYTAINVANATSTGPAYIEQLTYQFTYGLPVAASLNYGTFKLIDQANVTGPQYVSVSFGGTSYTAAYQGYATCTSVPVCTGLQKWNTVQASVTPTQGTIWLGIVDYTGTQWDAISSPPPLLSSNVVQYYWFVFLGMIATALGLSSAWISTGRRQAQIRSPRGVGRLPLRRDRRAQMRMETRHHVLVGLGVVMIAASLGAIWAVYTGADVVGTTTAFIGTFIVAFIVAIIVFAAYELSGRRRRRTGA